MLQQKLQSHLTKNLAGLPRRPPVVVEQCPQLLVLHLPRAHPEFVQFRHHLLAVVPVHEVQVRERVVVVPPVAPPAHGVAVSAGRT